MSRGYNTTTQEQKNRGRRKGYLLLLVLLVTPSILFAQVDMNRVVTIGRNAIHFKDYLLAIQLFNNAIQTDSTRAEPYYYRAVAKLSLDDYQGAEMDVSKCIHLNPFIYDAYYLRGIVRHNLGEDTLALSDYQRVLRNNPDHQGALHNSAVLFIALNQYDKATSTLDYLEKFYPHYAMGYVIDGGLKIQEKDTVTAFALFEKARQLDPTLVAAHLALADLFYQKSDFKSAEKSLNAAIEENNGDPALFVNRALVRFRQNNIRGSMDDYTTAIMLDPDHVLAHYNRALLRIQVGALNDALDDLNAVVLHDPHNDFALFNRAIVSNIIGRNKDAEKDLDRIIDQYPTFAPAYHERAKARKAQGNELGVKKDLYKISKLIENRPFNRKRQEKVHASNDTIKKENNSTTTLREETDKNIQKFKALVISTSRKNYSELYQEDFSIRGRLQDREVAVSPRPMMQLSYFFRSDLNSRVAPNRIYTKQLLLPPIKEQIYVVSDIPPLTQSQIRQYVRKVEEDYQVPIFKRIMNAVTIKDHSRALALLNQAIQVDSPLPVYYFQRSVSRFLASDLSITSVYKKEHQPMSAPQTSLQSVILEASLQDLEKVLECIPNYIPAIYNRGCLYYAQARYALAIEEYRKLLLLDPNLGDAYFNLALSYYAIGEKTLGDKAMSKAGSCGISDAYSIIKRMR